MGEWGLAIKVSGGAEGSSVKKIDAKTKGQIAKILPRLATATEVASSLAAINKLLAKGGYDWHDLTSLLNSGGDGLLFTEADATEIYRRGEASGREQARQEQPEKGADLPAGPRPGFMNDGSPGQPAPGNSPREAR